MEDLIRQFSDTFTSILYEALPFIVLGAVLSGLLEELVPQRLVAKIIPRNRFLAIALGGLLGLPFPMCECGIIPIMRRLLRKGVPLSCCVCYMLAGPIVNVVVMLSTFMAFNNAELASSASGTGQPVNVSTSAGGTLTVETPEQQFKSIRQLGGWEMLTLRMVLGYLVAFGTSVVVEFQYRKHGNKLLAPMAVPPPIDFKKHPEAEDEEEIALERRPWTERIGAISEAALHDFIDITVFLIFGAVLAAGTRLVLSAQQVAAVAQNYPIAILIMMGLAILLCICSEADAFVGASFRVLPPSSKLAFLVLGPMLDLKLYMMYTRVFRPRLIWTIITCVVVQVLIYSFVTHWVLQGVSFLSGVK